MWESAAAARGSRLFFKGHPPWVDEKLARKSSFLFFLHFFFFFAEFLLLPRPLTSTKQSGSLWETEISIPWRRLLQEDFPNYSHCLQHPFAAYSSAPWACGLSGGHTLDLGSSSLRSDKHVCHGEPDIHLSGRMTVSQRMGIEPHPFSEPPRHLAPRPGPGGSCC